MIVAAKFGFVASSLKLKRRQKSPIKVSFIDWHIKNDPREDLKRASAQRKD